MSRGAVRTAQQYDPLGALRARPMALVVGVVSILWAAMVSLLSRDVPGSPTLSALTVLLVAAAFAVLGAGSSPFRAPFPRSALVVQVVLLVAATVTSVAAQWGPDRNALNDFMAIVAGIGVLVAAPYRPWREVVVAGALLAAVNGVVWGTAAAVFPLGVPIAVVALLGAAPTMILTAAAGVFAATFVGLAERVQIRAGSYSVERAERDGITRSVQQDRVTILARDVAPFLEKLRGADVVTDEDRNRAREIADGIRRVMVADADRTWVEQALLAEGGDSATVTDPEGLLRGMDVDERTVVRTFLRAALRATTVDPAGLVITATRAESERPPHRGRPVRRAPAVVFDLALRVADSDVGIRRTFDPYLAVLRVTFPDLEVAIRPSSLALRFSYDQH